MKTAEEIRSALGEPDTDFDRAVLRTLARLREDGSRTGKRQRTVFVLAALGLLLAAFGAGATAAHWGLVDYLRRQGMTVTQEQQKQFPAPVPASARTSSVTLTVEETVHDGVCLYWTGNLQARSGILLVGNGTVWIDGKTMPVWQGPAADLEGLEDEEGTLAEYAARNELTLVCYDLAFEAEPVETQAPGWMWLGDEQRSGAGRVGWMTGVSCVTEEAEIPIEIICRTYVVQEGELTQPEEVRIALTVPAKRPERMMTSTEPVFLEQVGVRLDSVKVYYSDLNFFIRMDYTAPPESGPQGITQSLLYEVDGQHVGPTNTSIYVMGCDEAGRDLYGATVWGRGIPLPQERLTIHFRNESQDEYCTVELKDTDQ